MWDLHHFDILSPSFLQLYVRSYLVATVWWERRIQHPVFLNVCWLKYFLTLENIPERTAPPASAPLPLAVDSSPSAPQNYYDCTESNGEDDDEEEEGRGDSTASEAPRWEDFFSAGTLTDSQNSQSEPCCSVTSPAPSAATGSQTPELFSDEEETPNNEDFSLTLSASTSAHSSQNLELPDTVILRPERADAHHSETDRPEEAELSQASSDFDIPSTPESKVLRPEELSQLYRKLASGEEVMVRKGSQGSVWRDIRKPAARRAANLQFTCSLQNKYRLELQNFEFLLQTPSVSSVHERPQRKKL